MSENSMFDPGSPLINMLGDAVVKQVEKMEGKPVSFVMFLIDDETGRIVGTSNLPPEQQTDFLKHVLAGHRAGAYTREAFDPEKETKQ